jgi:hypothetical protein
VKDTLDKGIWL